MMAPAYPVPEELRTRIDREVRAAARELTAISHDLHDHPETAWNERRSAAVLAGALDAHGFEIIRGPGGLPTAFTATAGPSTAAVRVGVVAEYDALPGLGHACGHNVIAAAAVGAAIGLRPLLDELDLACTVIGTPAEEGGGGKILLLDAGVFDGLDAAMMVHPGPEDRAWAFPFAVAHFDVRYHGTAAHAAGYPWLGINAADAFVIAQTAIGLLRQQLPEGTRVHGVVTEAGTAPNAIPAESAGKWYVRARTLDELDELYAKVLRCFEAGALATGCTFEVEETSGRYSDFVNDEALVATFAAQTALLGRDLHVENRDRTGMNTASTDMGNVSHRVRAIHPYLDIGSSPVVNHQREFADAAVTPAADHAILDGSIALAATAVGLAVERAEGCSHREDAHD